MSRRWLELRLPVRGALGERPGPEHVPCADAQKNTGLALLALARARRHGHDVEAGAIEAGRKALLAMRERPAVYTYICPGQKNLHSRDSSAARGAGCEHALALLGAVPERDFDAAVDLFRALRCQAVFFVFGGPDRSSRCTKRAIKRCLGRAHRQWHDAD